MTERQLYKQEENIIGMCLEKTLLILVDTQKGIVVKQTECEWKGCTVSISDTTPATRSKKQHTVRAYRGRIHTSMS